jgi:hypothetical protein
MCNSASSRKKGPGLAQSPPRTSLHQPAPQVEVIDRHGPPAQHSTLPIKVAVLETNVDRLQIEMNELKTEFREFRKEMRAEIMAIRTHDFRLLFGAIITVAIGVAALMAKGFHWI